LPLRLTDVKNRKFHNNSRKIGFLKMAIIVTCTMTAHQALRQRYVPAISVWLVLSSAVLTVSSKNPT